VPGGARIRLLGLPVVSCRAPLAAPARRALWMPRHHPQHRPAAQVCGKSPGRRPL